jgi:hypothetical protein
MNDRIEKLADEAEEYAVRVTTGDWEVGLAYQDLFNKKFAELIVRECMSDLYLNGYDDAMIQIQKHFGVE